MYGGDLLTPLNSINSLPILREALFLTKKPVIVDMSAVDSFTTISFDKVSRGSFNVKELKYPRSSLGTGVTYLEFLSIKNA